MNNDKEFGGFEAWKSLRKPILIHKIYTYLLVHREVSVSAAAVKPFCQILLGLGRQWKSKRIPCASKSFSLFSWNFKWKMLVVMVSTNFSWISHHFDVWFNSVAESDHTYHQKILVAVDKGLVLFISITPDQSHLSRQKKGWFLAD